MDNIFFPAPTSPSRAFNRGDATWEKPRLLLLASGSTAAGAGHPNLTEGGHGAAQTLVPPFNIGTSDNNGQSIVCAAGPHS